MSGSPRRWPSVLRQLQDDKGQALPEFAIVAPLLFTLLFGVIQFGFLFGSHIGLTNATREIARYASTALINSNLNPQIAIVMPRSIPAFDATFAAVTTSYCWYADPGAPTTYSYRVAISAFYRHPLWIPLVGELVDSIDGLDDNRFQTGAVEEMRLETPDSNILLLGVSACPAP